MPRFVSLSLTCAVALCLAACDRETPETAQQQENSAASKQSDAGGSELAGEVDRSFAGSDLPDFTFQTPAGESLSLASLKGTPVLLNLWATWCAPCVVEMPMLDELAADYDGELRVLTVSQDMKGAELVEPFFAKGGYKNIEPWLDPQNDLGFHFGAGAVLPTTVLYDAQGKEVLRVVGGYEWNGEEARALVEEAL